METKKLLIFTAVLLLTAASGCSTEKKNETSIQYFNPLNLASDGSYYQFSGTIDQTVTTICGSAEAPADTSVSATPVTAMADTETRTDHLVTSYYIFELGKSGYTFNYPLGQATMFLKYKYSSTKDSFSLSPLSASSRYCPTLDYIKCNGTNGVSPECETTDGLTCGGTHSFSFVSSNKSTGVPGSEFLAPDLIFQAKNGTINWEKGYALNTNQDTVIRNYLDITMTDSEGKVFKAELYCDMPVY